MSLHTKRSPLTTSGPKALRPRRNVACERRRPTQSKRRHCCVDLIDDGQEVIRLQTASPMNLVHPDGFHTAQLAVSQAPLHKPFHRPIHRFPTGLERPRRLPPTESSRPARQESHHGASDRTFAVAPGNVLDDDPMFGARHPPGCVAKEGRDPPQGHKQPTPLGQAVIARRGPLAARATPAYPRMRFHGDQDRLRQRPPGNACAPLGRQSRRNVAPDSRWS